MRNSLSVSRLYFTHFGRFGNFGGAFILLRLTALWDVCLVLELPLKCKNLRQLTGSLKPCLCCLWKTVMYELLTVSIVYCRVR